MDKNQSISTLSYDGSICHTGSLCVLIVVGSSIASKQISMYFLVNLPLKMSNKTMNNPSENMAVIATTDRQNQSHGMSTQASHDRMVRSRCAQPLFHGYVQCP
jgi:hypothetical protein